MPHLSLDALAQRLSEQLQCEQEELCLPILHQVSRGKPLPKTTLATSLAISQDELEQRLTRLPGTEFDQEGHIVGWGVTLVPTRHRFQVDGHWPSTHPEALLLSIEEAALLGKLVAEARFARKQQGSV